MFWIFVLVGGAFVAYALYTQYSKTPAEENVPKRTLAALMAAAGAIGAAGWEFVKQMFHTTTAP